VTTANGFLTANIAPSSVQIEVYLNGGDSNFFIMCQANDP